MFYDTPTHAGWRFCFASQKSSFRSISIRRVVRSGRRTFDGVSRRQQRRGLGGGRRSGSRPAPSSFSAWRRPRPVEQFRRPAAPDRSSVGGRHPEQPEAARPSCSTPNTNLPTADRRGTRRTESPAPGRVRPARQAEGKGKSRDAELDRSALVEPSSHRQSPATAPYGSLHRGGQHAIRNHQLGRCHHGVALHNVRSAFFAHSKDPRIRRHPGHWLDHRVGHRKSAGVLAAGGALRWVFRARRPGRLPSKDWRQERCLRHHRQYRQMVCTPHY